MQMRAKTGAVFQNFAVRASVQLQLYSYRYLASSTPVDPTGRFAAVEFYDFMHMRVKTICRFWIRMEKLHYSATLLAALNRTV